ncbi:MAG: transposase [Burkholderiaceae bacterium]
MTRSRSQSRSGDPSLLPTSPLAKALNYARERRQGLSVFLSDAWLDLDTNDLERAPRVIPMGKKNAQSVFM